MLQPQYRSFDTYMDALEARIDAKFNALRASLVHWMFGFWTATVVPIIGLMLALNGVFSP